MDSSLDNVLEGEIVAGEPVSDVLRVRSIPRGFSSAVRMGVVQEAAQDGLGAVWAMVQWDGEGIDTKLYLLGRDVEVI